MHRTIYIPTDGDGLMGITNFKGGEVVRYDIAAQRWKLDSGMVIDHATVVWIERSRNKSLFQKLKGIQASQA